MPAKDEGAIPGTRLPRRGRIALGVVLVLVVAGLVAFLGYTRSLDTVPFSPDDARDGLGAGERPSALLQGTRSFVLVGSDSRGSGDRGRADVIMLVVLRPDGRPPVLASIPRDLWVDNPCTGGKSRVNAGLAGCPDRASGPELLGIMVEDLAGVRVDHYLQVDFDGFVDTVAQMGGVRICTDHPVRDRKAQLSLPGGCAEASAEQTLAWVRSRHTEEQTASGWRTMPGVSDLTRNERQQDVILQLAAKAASARSPADLSSLARGVQDNFVFDDRITTAEGVALGWQLRGVDLAHAERVSIPVEPWTTSGGAAVLLPQASLADLLAPLLDED